jgi:predicted RNA-binding Zn-ribbon protein involved in translation (DUF1610 family)
MPYRSSSRLTAFFLNLNLDYCCGLVFDIKELEPLSGTDELVCPNCHEFEVAKCGGCKKEFLISEMFTVDLYEDYPNRCYECWNHRPLTQEEIEQIKAERELREKGVI